VINDLKPYPEMKDTGLPWVVQIPSHWDLVPNRALIRKRKVLVGDRHADFRLLSLTKAGIIVRDVSTGRGKFSADMGTSQEVRQGDLVFCLFDVPETPRTVGLSKHHGMITGAYTVFECKDNQLARFLEVFYIAMDDRKLLSPLYSGLRNTIPPPVLLGQKTPLPPAQEQAAIVRFLDHADHKIRRYIRAKQKLIKLLEEQKQVIIHRAVTHGLDPNVRLKPSGVEWLGDVPEHWEVRRVRNCLEDTRAGIWGDDPTPANEADHVTCLRVADFDMTSLGVNGSKLTQRAVPESARLPRLLAAGDILMEKSGGGEAEPVGRVVLHDENVAPYAICSNFIIRLRPNRSATPQFLLHVLAIMQITRRNVPCIKQTTGIQNLDERAYLALAIGVPPIAEQRAIIASLREHLLPIEQGANRARHEINLLREYHTPPNRRRGHRQARCAPGGCTAH
jgi:type I restriction enzyme S subunit